MQAVFLVEGVLMGVFAFGLASIGEAAPPRGGRPQGSPPRGTGMASVLFALAGVGMMGLAFPADPTIRDTPATLAGELHDTSFAFLGLMLFPALLSVGRAFYSQARWRGLRWLTYLAAALILPTFALKGWWFYAFLTVFMLWSEAAAWRLMK